MAKKNKIPAWAIIAGSVVLVLVIVGLWIGGTYNSFVGLDETVKNAWANVQTAYQRRADLIPNLVATVDASADFEKDLQTKVTQLRAGIVNAEAPEDLEFLGKEINTAINLAFEAYPDIKTTEAFRDLQVQLEGTENRIKVERDNYNKAVRDYNVRVRRVPSNFIAGMFGFAVKEGFLAEAGSEVAPDVGELFEK